MAGDQDWNRIRAARAADGPDGLGFANRSRNFAIAFRFAEGNFPEFTPDDLLKFRPRTTLREIIRLTAG